MCENNINENIIININNNININEIIICNVIMKIILM